MTYDKHMKAQTRLAVLISTRNDSTPTSPRIKLARRAARWLVGRPPQQHRSLARRVGLAADAVATRLVVIPDSPHLRERYGVDQIPFIVDSRKPVDALQLAFRCQPLTREALTKALPFKRPLTLRPTSDIYGELSAIAATWPLPTGTCKAYKEAHDAMTAYVFHSDEETAVAFARKWNLTIRKRSAVLNGLISIDWDGVELYDDESVVSALNRQIRSERDNWRPIHTRQLKGHHIVLGVNSESRKQPRSKSAEDQYLDRQPYGHHPCLDLLLVDFTPQEAQAVAMYVFGSSNTDWHDAALLANASDPKRFGERVRRMVKHAAKRHRATANPATCTHGTAATEMGV
ncbi:hypothetical protein OG594_23900 [Streptomyces sp. NBC_01214]|uniref:hypothetical protein n=1 Tax=Streptomyces sp. NBC_01214 TaxID=2903777 RepID=UPI00225B3C67|nr:hypothetical protein [Streptomyces sp. NBC_01214]MCX4804627.1 hypothetical protein [Streptomyces sp. NBC_01214]